jgi:hypothetical protein
MCNPKLKVLNKEIKKPSLDPNEKISINLAFKNNNIRVTVLPVLTKKENAEEVVSSNKAMIGGIDKERNQIIEAHCVKQMKTNKVMMMNDLVQKVMASVMNFKAQPGTIKTRIQHLIENDYMERDKNDKAKLTYIP